MTSTLKGTIDKNQKSWFWLYRASEMGTIWAQNGHNSRYSGKEYEVNACFPGEDWNVNIDNKLILQIKTARFVDLAVGVSWWAILGSNQ